jgi:2,4-dienoyl-CoA reductase-like NADH-dependent reductase (Old Yellow Enzyme family)
MVDQYQYLFTPIRVGQTTIPNRIVFAAHLTNLAENTLPGPRLIAYMLSVQRAGVEAIGR